MSKPIPWKSAGFASLAFALTVAVVPQTISAAPMGDAGSQETAAHRSIQDDPSYQRYLRWNGFRGGASMTAPSEQAGAAGRPGQKTQAGSGNVVDDPSYKAYLRRNGFQVE